MFKVFTTENWAGVAMPVVKRTFPFISAKEFVSVQPMSLPSGLVFHFDFKYRCGLVVWDQELWWEEDKDGNWVCIETLNDHKISDYDWQKAVDDRLIIPKWEVNRDYGRMVEIKREVSFLNKYGIWEKFRQNTEQLMKYE